MRTLSAISVTAFLAGCGSSADQSLADNPFFNELNKPVEYAKVTPDHVEEYALVTVKDASAKVESIKNVSPVTFDNVFIAMDDIFNRVTVAWNNCSMLFYVSPDSLIREKGLAGFQRLDSLSTVIFSDKVLYNKLVSFQSSPAYPELKGHRKLLVDQMIEQFKQSGANLNEEQLAEYKRLTKEISDLSSTFSTNMNSYTDVLPLDEEGAQGLPESFKNSNTTGEFKYAIPIANATSGPVMSNARQEKTRKEYYMKFNNRASNTNVKILDELVQKRYQLAQLMGHKTYASYNLDSKMAKNPETVWKFVNDLVDRSKGKAKADIDLLKKLKKESGEGDLHTWDMSFYTNEILKNRYNVDHEKIREYLPMKECLAGMFKIYQELLGLEFKKVENPSVWHEEVELYDVYENGKLRGRFYLDLFPRPNKESWFYGVELIRGHKTAMGYEVPVSMLLGNFTRATPSLPSLVSHSELNVLFHEFGHIMNAMAYEGEFSYQVTPKADFVEAMSQIFENWIWNYEILSSFAHHYKTGEVLPKETFDNMLKAKNVGSGMSALSSLRLCTYDMNLYDKFNPDAPVNTDDLWKNIDQQFGVMPVYVEGTHPQSSWIHINTHPVYMYGYLWSEVYAQDMFTVFEKNGLMDQKTGIRYRKLILANGTQRDAMEAVEEFLGRPSNNEAYIKSLGLQ